MLTTEETIVMIAFGLIAIITIMLDNREEKK